LLPGRVRTLLVLLIQIFRNVLETAADVMIDLEEKVDEVREKLLESIDNGEITYKDAFRQLYVHDQLALSKRMFFLSSLLGSMGAKSDKVEDLKKRVDDRIGSTDESGKGGSG
jgi:hypothetical protein